MDRWPQLNEPARPSSDATTLLLRRLSSIVPRPAIHAVIAVAKEGPRDGHARWNDGTKLPSNESAVVGPNVTIDEPRAVPRTQVPK